MLQSETTDHDVVISYPKHSLSYSIGKLRSFPTRVKGHNEKVTFAYHLLQIKWAELYHIEPCEDKVRICESTLQDLYDNWFPVKVVIRHDRDKPLNISKVSSADDREPKRLVTLSLSEI